MIREGIARNVNPAVYLDYNKEQGIELLNRRDLIGDILDDVDKVVTGDGVKIANALLWGQVGLNAPDLRYISLEGIARVKRPQTHTFILSPNGSVGIDTTYSVLEPLFTKSRCYNTLTQGSLTARANQTERELDNSLVFLREFTARNEPLVNDLKSVMEERKLTSLRSYDGASVSETTEIKINPSLFIGCNNVNKLLDVSFYSRFDFAYCFNPSKETLRDIKDKQIQTLPNKTSVTNFVISENQSSKLSNYRNAFALLSDQFTDDWFISFEDIKEDFDFGVSEILALEGNTQIKSRYPRDVESGIRLAHLSAWLHHRHRLIEQMNDAGTFRELDVNELDQNHTGIKMIYANADDLACGINQAKHTFHMKKQFLEITAELDREDKKTKTREREFYLENYEILQHKSYREQADWLRNAGFVVSHNTIARWDKQQTQLTKKQKL